MGRCVDFTLEDLLGAGNREGRDLATQFFARARDLLFGVGLGGGNDTRAFFGGGALGFSLYFFSLKSSGLFPSLL